MKVCTSFLTNKCHTFRDMLHHRFSYIRIVPGLLFVLFVFLHIFLYISNVVSKDEYDILYIAHILFQIYEMIITVAIFPPKLHRTAITLYNGLCCIILAFSGFFGNIWWLNIFFIKHIYYISEFVYARIFWKLMYSNAPFGMSIILPYSNFRTMIKCIKYVCLCIVLYLSYTHHFVSTFIIISSCIMVEFLNDRVSF